MILWWKTKYIFASSTLTFSLHSHWCCCLNSKLHHLLHKLFNSLLLVLYVLSPSFFHLLAIQLLTREILHLSKWWAYCSSPGNALSPEDSPDSLLMSCNIFLLTPAISFFTFIPMSLPNRLLHEIHKAGMLPSVCMDRLLNFLVHSYPIAQNSDICWLCEDSDISVDFEASNAKSILFFWVHGPQDINCEK